MPKKALDSRLSDSLEWRLRELRLAANVTLEQLASEVGLSAATLCLTERGQRPLTAERALSLVAGLMAIRQKRRAAFQRLLREIGHDPAAEDWVPADTAEVAG